MPAIILLREGDFASLTKELKTVRGRLKKVLWTSMYKGA